MKNNYLFKQGIISLGVIISLFGCEKNDSVDTAKTNLDANSLNEQFEFSFHSGSELRNNQLGLSPEYDFFEDAEGVGDYLLNRDELLKEDQQLRQIGGLCYDDLTLGTTYHDFNIAVPSKLDILKYDGNDANMISQLQESLFKFLENNDTVKSKDVIVTFHVHLQGFGWLRAGSSVVPGYSTWPVDYFQNPNNYSINQLYNDFPPASKEDFAVIANWGINSGIYFNVTEGKFQRTPPAGYNFVAFSFGYIDRVNGLIVDATFKNELECGNGHNQVYSGHIGKDVKFFLYKVSKRYL